jgi:hypothetical protein
VVVVRRRGSADVHDASKLRVALGARASRGREGLLCRCILATTEVLPVHRAVRQCLLLLCAAPLPCTGCDQGYHTYCVNRCTVPLGDWYCPTCRQQRRQQQEQQQQARSRRQPRGTSTRRPRRIRHASSADDVIDLSQLDGGAEELQDSEVEAATQVCWNGAAAGLAAKTLAGGGCFAGWRRLWFAASLCKGGCGQVAHMACFKRL